jgi:hypothetical protein
MQIVPSGLLTVNNMRGAYPFQAQPQVTIPDYLAETSGVYAAGLSDLVLDVQANCVYARPLLVPHDQKVGDASITPTDADQYLQEGMPDISWESVTASANVTAQCFQSLPEGNQTLAYVWNGTGEQKDNSISGKVKFLDGETRQATAQGFTAHVTRQVIGAVPADANCSWVIHCVIGPHRYSFGEDSGGHLRIIYGTEDGSAYGAGSRDLITNARGAGPTVTGRVASAGEGRFPVEALLINSCLTVNLGGQRYSFPVAPDSDGNPYALIDAVSFGAVTFSLFECSLHPAKFVASGTYRSAPLSLGFSPAESTPPRYTLYGASGMKRCASGEAWSVDFPAGSTIKATTATEAGSADPQYDLAISNTAAGSYAGVSYADATALCTRVCLTVDGIWVSALAPASAIVPKNAVRETISFDPNALTIGHSLYFNADNYYGQWAGQSGNIAVQLKLGYAQPAWGLFPHFTGVVTANTFDRPSGNRATVGFHCQDLMLLFDETLPAPPPMDGWNHYYAMAYLAERGGLTRSQMAFSALVPDDPFSYAPGDPAPYFLPMGFGMNPWTPRNDTVPIRALMDYVRKPLGFLLYFDAQGYLRYEKWIPELAGAPKQVFTEGASGFDGSNLSEFWGFSGTASTQSVRNRVLLIGLDPFSSGWNPIVCRREDSASINALPGAEPANYLGFPRSFIWVDSRFANMAFASLSADRLLQMLRIPEITVEFDCLMQPQLYPMDVILIGESRSGMAGIPFYVMSVTNTWNLVPGDGGFKNVCRSHVSGRFLV